MVSPITDSQNEIAAPINVIYQQTLLRNAKSNCPHYAGTQPAVIQQNRGSFTAKWRKIANLSKVTAPLSELTGNVSFPTRDAVTPTVTDVTKALAKYGNHFVLNEEADLVNFSADMDKLAEVLGINAGESLDGLQAVEEESNSTQIFANGTAATAVNTILTEGKLQRTVNELGRQNAMKFSAAGMGDPATGTTPVPASYWGICHPDVEEDIRGMTTFKAVEDYAGHVPIMPGEFGMVKSSRIRFVSSTNATITVDTGAIGGTDVRETSNSKADLYFTVVYGQGAFGSVGLNTAHIQESYRAGDQLPGVMMINKPLGSAGAADPFNELQTMAWKSWHAAKTLDTNFSRSIVSAATNLSN